MTDLNLLRHKVRIEGDTVNNPATPLPPRLSPPAPPLRLLCVLLTGQLAAPGAPGSMSIIGSVT